MDNRLSRGSQIEDKLGGTIATPQTPKIPENPSRVPQLLLHANGIVEHPPKYASRRKTTWAVLELHPTPVIVPTTQFPPLYLAAQYEG